MLHLSDAWGRRHDPNVVLLHYDDLLADLDGAMRRLAAQLGIAVDEGCWPGLVRAATFEEMREPRALVVPRHARRVEGPGGVLPPRRVG